MWPTIAPITYDADVATVSEMAIDVMVAAEFLFQAGYSEAQRELASTFVHRRMLAVETSPLQGSAAHGDNSR